MLSDLPHGLAKRLLPVPAPDGVDVSGDCLIWQGWKKDGGYGYVRWHSRNPRRVHRLTYELVVGPIPEGLVLDHLCCVKSCANPAHLEPVTQLINARRGKLRDFCHRGHPYDDENTYRSPRGKKQCRECARISRRARAQKKRAPAVTGGSPGRRSEDTTTVRGLPNDAG